MNTDTIQMSLFDYFMEDEQFTIPEATALVKEQKKLQVNDFHKEKYEAIYIGQSLHLASRVKQHLQGNGNKKVYYDYQNRKQIYIHLERCMPSYMNRMEKDLIRSFKATRSYNIQKGGGKHRRNKDNFKYK